MNFRDYIPSVPFIKFKYRCLLVFDLTSMQYGTEIYLYTELVGEPMSFELNNTNALEYVTEPIKVGERMSLVAVDIFGVVGKRI